MNILYFSCDVCHNSRLEKISRFFIEKRDSKVSEAVSHRLKISGIESSEVTHRKRLLKSQSHAASFEL